MLLQMAKFHSFHGWVMFRYVCVCVSMYIQCLHPFIYQWELRLLPYLGCCKHCSSEHTGTSIFFFGSVPCSGIAGSHSSFSFSVWGTSILFSIVAMPIYIPTNSAQAFVFFTSLSTFVICGLFDDSHSDRCKEISHCDFNLHLPIIHDFEKVVWISLFVFLLRNCSILNSPFGFWKHKCCRSWQIISRRNKEFSIPLAHFPMVSIRKKCVKVLSLLMVWICFLASFVCGIKAQGELVHDSTHSLWKKGF